MKVLDLTEEERRRPCQCCAEDAAQLRDEDLGPVCSDCFCLLINTRNRLLLTARAWRKEEIRG